MPASDAWCRPVGLGLPPPAPRRPETARDLHRQQLRGRCRDRAHRPGPARWWRSRATGPRAHCSPPLRTWPWRRTAISWWPTWATSCAPARPAAMRRAHHSGRSITGASRRGVGDSVVDPAGLASPPTATSTWPTTTRRRRRRAIFASNVLRRGQHHPAGNLLDLPFARAGQGRQLVVSNRAARACTPVSVGKLCECSLDGLEALVSAGTLFKLSVGVALDSGGAIVFATSAVTPDWRACSPTSPGADHHQQRARRAGDPRAPVLDPRATSS